MAFTFEQLAVIHHPGGHALVSAVAGSGKTTTMIGRIGQLLSDGVEPRRILVVMFNRIAAEDFRDRLIEMLKQRGLPRAACPKVRTFHALGYRLVETFEACDLLPRRRFEEKESVLTAMAMGALNQARRDHQAGGYPDQEEKDDFLRFIDLVKSNVRSEIEIFEEGGFEEYHAYFVDAYRLFEEQRIGQGIRFFADLVWEPVMAMRRSGDLVAKVANLMDHIIVDEYQDINEVQQTMLRFIAGERAQVMAVGDPDQCIYEWRGARPEYITFQFEQDFPGATRYVLSQTFRYGHALSMCANHLITRNTQRDDKLCLSSETTPTTRIEILRDTPVTGDEHPVVVLLKTWGRQRPLAEAAILLRLWSLSIPVELALLEAGIPYDIEGRESLFDDRAINALIGVIRLAAGRMTEIPPANAARLIEDMLSTPHLGLKQDQVRDIAAKIASDPDKGEFVIAGATTPKMRQFLSGKINRRANLWSDLVRGQWKGLSPGQVIERYMQATDMKIDLRRSTARIEDGANKVLAAEAMLAFAQRFNGGSLSGFLDRIEQLREADSARRTGGGDRVIITTMHRSKGLEWPMVIVPGLDDATFPGTALAQPNVNPEAVIEAERRLFYVAVTRAKERLVLLAPEDARLSFQMQKGSRDVPTGHVASRFLFEANLRVSENAAAALKGDAAEVRGHDVSVVQRYFEAIAGLRAVGGIAA